MVASRPEPHIRQALDSPSSHYRSFNVEQSFHDVRKYLHDEFSRIHRDHWTMREISSPWPEPSVLEQLVRKSSGYFIYASTIIKFIGDENFRPTVRLEVIQNTNSPGSESAYDALDQLYMTILSSVARQSELIPILCVIFTFGWCPDEIDKLFLLAKGETLLLLRGLHSVLEIRSSKAKIFSHHASFVDFLKHPGRSGIFCIDILNNQISLARSLLPYYAGPFQRHKNFTLSALIRFIVSLPPCDAVADLFPLIGSINPDCIFDPEEYRLRSDDFKGIVSWLETNPSAPADVIQLWEDYAFMFSIDKMKWSAEVPSVKHNVSPSPELVRILLILGLLHCRLWELPTKFDLTWIDLRITLCSLRPKLAGNEHILPGHQPQIALSWAARDLALELIRKIVKNHMDTYGGVNPVASRDALLYKDHYPVCSLKKAYTTSQCYLGCDIAYLVRLSPPCSLLYRELWSIPPSGIWSSLPSASELFHHVSKWLASFPDSTMDLITFWQQAAPEHERKHINSFHHNSEDWENDWHGRVRHYNELHLPDSFKIIL
ncbi:Nwd2 [Mycena sanguinolenta]|uniref:Nwd2 n=1 Tax=Mycena sanguinolenta TaxID=230812 RepID=A0A8H7DFY6_9AGAR|nr:Nwd2 [Mycena sanguinolenta]